MIKMFFDPTDMRYIFKNCRTIDIWRRKSIKRKIRSNNKIFYKKYRYLKKGK